MDMRNRMGLYGSYFLGMAGIGFTLPYLPLYLGQEGLSDRAIGVISMLAALAGLAQYPVGLWSDRLGRRKPFLVAALLLLALSTFLLYGAHGAVWLGLLVLLFGENGACRATVESLAGAEAAHLARPDEIGSALAALRFWKPISIVVTALLGGWIVEQAGVGTILLPLAFMQSLAVVAALLIHERRTLDMTASLQDFSRNGEAAKATKVRRRDRTLWVFVAAMILFHIANSPGGIYLGLFMKRDLGASERYLSYAFVVSMAAAMLAVRPIGRWADRLGRRPLLVVGWAVMSLRLALVAVAVAPWQVLAIQIFDGLAQAFFAVVAAAWVTDRLADAHRVGEAQVVVGTSLVFGSAVGPLLAGLMAEAIGYRMMFGLLAGVGAAATGLVIRFIPETIRACEPSLASAPLALSAERSTVLEGEQ